MRFPRQEWIAWSVLPLPSPGDLPNPGPEPVFLALLADSLPLSHLGGPSELMDSVFFFFFNSGTCHKVIVLSWNKMLIYYNPEVITFETDLFINNNF